MKRHYEVWDEDVEKILISEEELDATVCRIAAEIDRDYADKNLLLLCILKGSVVFCGDLMKRLSIPCEIDCMKVSSYGEGTTSTKKINILLDLHRNDLSERISLLLRISSTAEELFLISPIILRSTAQEALEQFLFLINPLAVRLTLLPITEV